MKRVILSVLVVLLAVAAWRAVPSAQNGEAPTVAFDITKADAPRD